MRYEDIINDEEFFKWQEYAQFDVQYYKYAESNPSLVAVGHKIEDVYWAFCNARASFMSAAPESISDIAGDISRLYARTHFLLNAIIEYAICLDISWQVVWAYAQPTSLEYLMEQKYKEMEKECTRDSILERLRCNITQNRGSAKKERDILEIITKFDNDDTTVRLRSMYNKIKHQGTIYFEGLGDNPRHLYTGINGKKIPMLHRECYKVEDIEELLFVYHSKFKHYMNELIHIMVPDEYLEEKMALVPALNAMIELSNWGEE